MTTLEITTDRDQYEHARGNAKGWYETIRDLYRDSEALEGEGDHVTERSQEEIETEISEGPLSLEVRTGWRGLSDYYTNRAPDEYMILLSTGGPALRIWGEVDEHGEPENARLEMQDWGVPWREVWPCELDETDECRAALLWYAGHFYFGE